MWISISSEQQWDFFFPRREMKLKGILLEWPQGSVSARNWPGIGIGLSPDLFQINFHLGEFA